MPENKTVESESGTMPYSDHGKRASLLDVACNFDIHLEHACGGSCACTPCHVIVLEGEKNLSEAEDDEVDRRDIAPGLTLGPRLGCQAVIADDVKWDKPGWNKNFVSDGGQ